VKLLKSEDDWRQHIIDKCKAEGWDSLRSPQDQPEGFPCLIAHEDFWYPISETRYSWILTFVYPADAQVLLAEAAGEFRGEKFITVRDTGDYHSADYVDWLEQRAGLDTITPS